MLLEATPPPEESLASSGRRPPGGRGAAFALAAAQTTSADDTRGMSTRFALALLLQQVHCLQQPRAASRRALLAGAPALLTLAVPGPARADPSLLSSLQGPLQDVIAPGHWIGQFAGLNSKSEVWDFSGSSPEAVSAALVSVLDELTPERRLKLLIPEFRIARADAAAIHVLTWTKSEWLDSFDVKLEKKGNGGCRAKASFYATGFFPTSLPLAPLLNIAMAWLPFASPGPRNEMLQDFRLRALKGLLDKKLASR